ncbi:hypothetical protein D4R52_00385 [bacterium]|nr:MAG: hypothetical protein D4R52_00385 [bacterium]
MIDETEQFISDQFQSLPLKAAVQGAKEAVWLKVQNHIRSASVRKTEPFAMRSPFWSFFSLVKVVTTVVILSVIVTLGSITRASRGSIPGQALYPVKKAVEKVEVALAPNDATKVQVLSNQAKARLEEVKILVQEKQSTQIVAQTINDLKAATQEVVNATGSNPELAVHAVRLSSEEEQVLTSVQANLIGEAKQAAEEAIAVSRDTITKLGTNQGVKGADTLSNASSTLDTISGSKQGQKTKDGTVESHLQIHGVTSTDPEKKPGSGDPVILPEPEIGF